MSDDPKELLRQLHERELGQEADAWAVYLQKEGALHATYTHLVKRLRALRIAEFADEKTKDGANRLLERVLSTAVFGRTP